MKRMEQQKGSALVYILIAIALLAALTATFMDSSSQQTSSQNTFNTVTDLNSQINFIRSAIQECILTYPGGDARPAVTGQTTPPVVIPYPLDPDNAALLNPQAAGIKEVQFLRCPGNPGDDPDHAKMFGGSSGKFMPPPPSLFGPWNYYNGADGVFFWTSTDNTDAFLLTALQKLDDQFSECEADIINSQAPAATNDLTTEAAAGPQCLSGNYCFRVWIVKNSPSVYPGDTDGDEAAATCNL